MQNKTFKKGPSSIKSFASVTSVKTSRAYYTGNIQ